MYNIRQERPKTGRMLLLVDWTCRTRKWRTKKRMNGKRGTWKCRTIFTADIWSLSGRVLSAPLVLPATANFTKTNNTFFVWFPLLLVVRVSVAVQRHRGAVQLPPVNHVLLDARRRSLSSHHHRVRVQRLTAPALVLCRHRMGYV